MVLTKTELLTCLSNEVCLVPHLMASEAAREDLNTMNLCVGMDAT